MNAVAGLVAVPKGVLTSALRKQLTVTLPRMDDKDPIRKVHLYQTARDVCYLPRDYAATHFPDARIASVDGEAMTQRIEPIALHQEQVPWVDEICTQFQNRHDVIAKAGVGKGKTVMALEVVRRLGRAALVLVDQDFLKNQWIERAMQFYGVEREQIGIVQGPLCDYEGKVLVIGMIQSLYQKQYPQAFYDHFGTVVLDEVHSVGAPQFSKVLCQFPARHRLGVSATPDRGDALNKVLRTHLGPVRVDMESQHAASQVRIVQYEGCAAYWYSNITKKEGRFVSEMSEDTDRNLMLAELIRLMWGRGRQMLIIGGRIGQLQELIEMCVLLGVERTDCGLVTGSEVYWRYIKDPNPVMPPPWWDGEADYCPVVLAACSRSIKRSVLEQRKEQSQLIFSTYGMFAKGVDVPRLDTGLDVTPRGKSKQVNGRILRVQKGKAMPIWITVRDKVSYRCEYQLMNRLAEYAENNAEVYLWRLDKGLKKQDVATLRQKLKERVAWLQEGKILTRRDGRNIVLTPTTGEPLNSARSKPTAGRTRRRRVVSRKASA